MYVKIIQAGQYTERYEYQRYPNVSKFKKISLRRGERNPNGAKQRVVQKKSWKSISRAKQQFIRLVNANLDGNPPVFLTLTLLDCSDVATAYKIWTKFSARVKRIYSHWRFIAIPEWQVRGVIHLHALVWGLPSDLIFQEVPYEVWKVKKKKIRKRFQEFCEREGYQMETARGDRTIQNLWGYGYVDCLPTDGASKLVGYFAKYMRKSLSDVRLGGKRAYLSSRGLLRPVSIATAVQVAYAEEVLGFGVDNQQLIKSTSYDTLWLGRCNYSIYKKI